MKKYWWQDTVAYQIYPKSFFDANGDGVGDIQGITEKLDYLQELGVNVIWICPIQKSPMKDNGYDISDYYAIDGLFGTNDDYDELLREAERRGIKVLMDLVVNHCSSEHPWFQSALENPDGKYGKYFYIVDSPDGPPNNFRGIFGHNVWTRIPGTTKYYFHAYLDSQVDLNWECKELRDEILQMMQYWVDRGVAGFRIDAIGNLKKSKEILSYGIYPPDAPDGMCDSERFLKIQPGIEDFFREMDEKVFSPNACMTVAEIDVPDERLENFIGDNGFFSMTFDFSCAQLDLKGITTPCGLAPWTLADLKRILYRRQLAMQKSGWAALYWENHDLPRSLNRYLPEGEISFESATMLGTIYFFLRGTPFIFQGQEIGMTNYPFNDISQFDDLSAIAKYHQAKGQGVSEQEILKYLVKRSRDNSRTPMQWNDGYCAGFSQVRPWLAVNPNRTKINVESQGFDEGSILSFYKKMIWLRRHSEYHDALTYGSFQPVETSRVEDFVYKRIGDNHEILVIANYSRTPARWPVRIDEYRIILNNYHQNHETMMQPYQAVVSAKPCCQTEGEFH